MKKIFILLIAVLITVTIYAQSPNKLSYQAVVRNSGGVLVQNSNVGFKISILQSTSNGIAVYVETHIVATNANGLATLEIGGGSVVSGTFATIDWSAGPYFLKTETDPAGGTTYTISGTSQLLSVPYALNAKTAESITGTITETDPVYTSSQAANITATDITNLSNLSGANTGDQNGSETKVTAGINVIVTGAGTTVSPYVVNATTVGAKHYIGELYGGGIVVAFWNISGVEHGLIASLTDVSAGSAWSNVTSVLIGATAGSVIDGQSNTNAIIAQPGHTASAAKLCDDYISGGFSDWYLPAAWELNQCYNQVFVINLVLGANGFQYNGFYWCSTEVNSVSAFSRFIYNGIANAEPKSNAYTVRAVRKF